MLLRELKGIIEEIQADLFIRRDTPHLGTNFAPPVSFSIVLKVDAGAFQDVPEPKGALGAFGARHSQPWLIGI
jgi:hypothetical protein